MMSTLSVFLYFSAVVFAVLAGAAGMALYNRQYSGRKCLVVLTMTLVLMLTTLFWALHSSGVPLTTVIRALFACLTIVTLGLSLYLFIKFTGRKSFVFLVVAVVSGWANILIQELINSPDHYSAFLIRTFDAAAIIVVAYFCLRYRQK